MYSTANPGIHYASYASTFSREADHFFAILKCVKRGKLFLITPDKEVEEFAGSEAGPTAILQMRDWAVFDEIVARDEIGFAETYIGGRWNTPNLVALLTFVLCNSASLEIYFYGKPRYALWLRLKYFLHGNSIHASRRNIRAHYDLGSEFYALWLDESMTYSCALFDGDNHRSLEEAQQVKYERILTRLDASPGEHVLDIGCGWGGFAIAAARQGLRVTAVTNSAKQAIFVKYRAEQLGLDSLVTVEEKDYRAVEGVFDHVVSIGMFEHVGERYWSVYFRTIREHLKPGGVALIQCITLQGKIFERLRDYSGFIGHFIFPGGMLPTKERFRVAAAAEGLVRRETFTFGNDYIRTLQCWLTRFQARKQQLLDLGFDEAFLRMWCFCLTACQVAFECQRTDVMQVKLVRS